MIGISAMVIAVLWPVAAVECQANSDCVPEEYCVLPYCSASSGMCAARPGACPEYYLPVCGCDGVTYDNECFAAWFGTTIDYPGPCGPCAADLDHDGWVGAADLATLLGAWGQNPGHQGDLDDNGWVDAADLATLLGYWGQCWPAAPYLASYANSGCLPPDRNDDAPCVNDDVIQLIVEGTTLRVEHLSATYNCCPDDIVVSLISEDSILHFTEEEILTLPCFCLCCYNVEATASGLTPGATYTVEYCWLDYEQGNRCVMEMVEIPQP